MKRRRVLVISSLNPAIRNVIAALAEHHNVVAVFQPVAPPKKWNRLLRDPGQLVADTVLNHWHSSNRTRLHRFVRRHFQVPGTALGNVPRVKVPRDRINSDTTAQRIAAIDPEVIFVCGAPLLQRNIYSLAREAAINLHHGITPDYRGENTLFWALFNSDPNGIGVTFHLLDEGFDSGAVMEQCWPALRGGENEKEVWLACQRLAVRRAPLLVSELPSARPQREKGRFYPIKKRTPLADLKLYLRRPDLPARDEKIR